MSYPYIPATLARERQDTLLAEAEAVRQASSQPRARSGDVRLAWSRLVTRRPAAGSAATGRPVAIHDS